jgi:hypothetical protein
MNTSQLIASALIIKNNIQIHHWMSDTLNQHSILGELYEAVEEPLDMIVEVQSLEEEGVGSDTITMKLTAGKVTAAESIQMIDDCMNIIKSAEPSLSRGTKAAVDSLYEIFAKAKFRLKLELNSGYNSPA